MNTLSTDPVDCFRLLIRPAPDVRENLAGYLLRVAELNCLRHMQELREFLGTHATYPSQPSLIPQFGIYDLARLGKELNIPVSRLDTIVQPLNVRVGKFRKFRHQGKLWPLEMLRDKHRAWCPLCLKEAHIQQASWDWRLQSACSRHKVILVEHCPSCQRHVSWRYSTLQQCVCGYPLAEAPVVPACPAWQSITVSDLPPHQLMRYLTLVLLALEGELLDLAPLAVSSHEQIHQATLGIAEAQLQAATPFQDAVIVQVEKRHMAYPSLGPRHAVACLLIGLGLEPSFDAELASIASYWLHTKSLLPVVNNYSPEDEIPALPMPIVATTLNVSSHIIKTLLRKEILMYSANNELALRKRIDKQEVIDGKSLARLLHRLSNINEPVLNGKAVQFDHYGIDYARRLDLLLDIDEQYTRVIAFNPVDGLPSLSLCKTLITVDQNESLLSIRKAAEFLGIYPDAVYRLIKANFLTAKALAKRQACIDIKDLSEFRETYVFTHEIAQKLMCNPTNLADRIISIGILPVHGPAIDGGLTYAFRRKDITDDVLQKISLAETYQSRAGRRKKRRQQNDDQFGASQGMLTTKELSKTTGISAIRIRHEAKYGCLSEVVTHAGPNGKNFQFHTSAIGILRLFAESKNWPIRERYEK